MAHYNTVINNQFLDIAVLGNLTKTLTAQVAVSPAIGLGSSIVSGLLVNPVYSLSSGTLFGEQITPQFSPGAGNTYDAVYGLSVGQTVTPANSGSIINLIGMSISGPVVSSNTLTNSYSLFVTNASGTVTNNYTAILGDRGGIPRVGIGTSSPLYPLDAAGTINTNRVYTGAITGNNQLFQLAQGYNQAGLCSGVVGTHKTMSQNTTDYFDTALLNNASKGFYGAVFDGRFIYCVPNNNGLSGLITRYDSVFSFSDSINYTCFDTTAVSAGSIGFRGGVFDQRYVYFVPSSGTITRYDTMSPFWSTCSYTCFDLAQLLGRRIGYQGAVYDGRYLYFVPSDEGALFHGTVVRYDTTLSFTVVESYTSFNMKQLSPNAAGFIGGVYDGRYVYYVPYKTNNGFSGTAVRYDTTLSFTATASYTCFDLATVSSDCAGFRGAVFDGRFIYYAPYQNNTNYFGRIARYDTLFSFTSISSYTTFDTTTVSSASRGFFGAVFDGRYIYFVPSRTGGSDYSGTVTRFDTTLSFFQTGSYQIFDTSAGNTQSRGFIGGIYDGRYVYLMPNGSPSASGEITRLDAYPGERATSIAIGQAPSGLAVGTYANLFAPAGGLIVSGNVGVNQTFADYELDVNGTINAVIWVNVSSFLGFLGSTADNQHINVSQGYVQGGFGSGSVGTNKALSLNTTEFYDLTQGGTMPLAGYAGGVFDGRYIYYVPYLNNGNSHGTVARYDTLFPFTAPSSYRFFDLTQLNANAVQFVGGLYDGRYIYFVPYGLSFNHYFIQYDTTLSFTAFGSYSIFDLSVFGISSIVGFGGGAFDGRYIYLAPTWNGGGSGQEVNTTIMRYDSTQPFIASSSYSTFNTKTIDPTQTSFFGATFDGQYIYFIPYNAVGSSSGSVTRYDTALPFSKSTSYSIFNLQAINSICKQYYGGLFDGRYVYYIPNSWNHLINTLFIRYDTYLPFSSVSSYTAFNLLSVDPTNTYQAGGVFDGRYIYFGHFGQPPDLGSTIIRYDTTRPFNSPNSYTCLGVGQAINYRGVVTDGRYIYFVPSDNKFSAPNASSSGTIVRIDAYPGPQATAMIASQAPNGFAIGSFAGNTTPYAGENAPLYGSLIVGGRVGVNTATPQFDMDVNGTINVSQTFLTGLLGSTIDNQNINIAEGNNQGGLGGGSVGTNKALSLATTAFYDLTQQGTQPSLSVFGAGVFDGRYIYFVPGGGTVARYDTSLPFSSSGSYSAYNLTKLNALAQGFWGGLYDGQYVYFLPIGNSAIAPVIVQYNTALPFNSATSYTVFALTSIGVPSNAGYGGGVFDGRYIYLSPATGNPTNPNSSTIVRYDTTLSFVATASYSTFNIRAIATGLTQYFGGVYDGRYVYFMPYHISGDLVNISGSIMRYDTTLSFNAASSYAVYDLQPVSAEAVGYFGGIFDGRYVYLIPAVGKLFTRYDTMQPFQSAGSYTTFAVQSLIDLFNAGGYAGGVFDGRYIYMGQINFFGTESRGATIVRYDTTLPFNAPSSYTCIGTGQIGSYRGAVFDGHYVYFVPASSGSGTIVRLDAYPGPQATAMAAYQAPNGFVVGDYVGSAAAADGGLLISDNMGIGTNNPQYTLDVNGTMQTIAITPINTQPVYANGATTRNQLITLAEGYNQGFGSGSVGTNKQMSINGSAVYDTLPVTGSTVGYTGAVFDGRYVYLIPGNAVYLGSPNPSTLTRYDTTLPLSNAGSYTSFNLLRIHSTCVGYLGGVFDGRYVYLTPYNTATITRYDTFQNFNAVSSYTTCNLLNAGMSGTLSGAAFDGRYIYFSALTAVLSRFDTTLPFNSPDSYDSKLLPSYTISNFNTYSFGGCIYDGRYVYLAPTRNSTLNSTIVRYDTALPFLSADSYTWFDLRRLTATSGGLGIGTFDGRYVYFMSNIGVGFSLDSSTIVRYDTQQSFLLAGSYTIFNTLQVHPSPIIFSGAVFDGRYVYFTPAYTSSATVVIRYDTTLRFNAAASYTALSTMTINTQSRGFSGGVFDGQYVYLTPYSTSSLTRIDAYPGPQATAIAASQAPNGFAVGNYAGTTAANGNLIISGNFGIGTSTPTFSLQLGVGTSAKPGVGGTWTTTSDVRIKTNIQDVSGSLNMIRQLRPRKYRFRPEYAKDIQADSNAFYYGFVADEVEGVIDGCVSRSGIHCSGGQEASSELMNLKTLNIHNILVHSIHAIKELADRGDQLKQQIDGLNN